MSATSTFGEAWHYPPDLLELACRAVSLLNKGKSGELDFFRGAGVPEKYLSDAREQVARDRGSISKFEIARRVLVQLSEAGDSAIAPRREIEESRRTSEDRDALGRIAEPT